MAPDSRAELCVVGAAAPSAAVLIMGLNGPGAAALTVSALVLSLLAARAVVETGRTPRALWPAVLVLGVLAVTRGPIGSHDLWSYSFYGRMVTEYRVDPYRAVPAMFPHDVVYPVVGWRHTPSGYGPLFTFYSAATTALAGGSKLVMRLGFQLVAAGAVTWCLWVLSRARRHAALTLVALQPFIWVSVVNGGHNDAILAAVLLAAVIAFDRHHTARTAALVGVAALVKMSAIFVVVPLVVLLLARRRWRDAATMAVVPLGGLVAGELVAPGSLANASSASRGIVSRASVWRPVSLVSGIGGVQITLLATGFVAVLIVAISWRHRNDVGASVSAGGSLSVFGMASSYTLPWYLVWGVPALALSGDLAVLSVVVARGSLMAASYQLKGSSIEGVPGALLSILAPVALLGVFLRRILVLRPTSFDGRHGSVSPSAVRLDPADPWRSTIRSQSRSFNGALAVGQPPSSRTLRTLSPVDQNTAARTDRRDSRRSVT